MSAVDARSSHLCAVAGHTSSHSRRNQIRRFSHLKELAWRRQSVAAATPTTPDNATQVLVARLDNGYS
jgi:hypothetical protein